MKTLKQITPAIETDIISQLKEWLKDDKNNETKMEQDFWQSFTVTAEGFEGCVVDVQVLVDEDITVYMYPCDEIQVIEKNDNSNEYYLGGSWTNSLVYTQEFAEPLFPVWLWEYHKQFIQSK